MNPVHDSESKGRSRSVVIKGYPGGHPLTFTRKLLCVFFGTDFNVVSMQAS